MELVRTTCCQLDEASYAGWFEPTGHRQISMMLDLDRDASKRRMRRFYPFLIWLGVQGVQSFLFIQWWLKASFRLSRPSQNSTILRQSTINVTTSEFQSFTKEMYSPQTVVVYMYIENNIKQTHYTVNCLFTLSAQLLIGTQITIGT